MARHKARARSRGDDARAHQGRCHTCNKLSYSDRTHAKRALRRIFVAEADRRDVAAYRCPTGQGFHLGHDTLWRAERSAFVRRSGGAA